MSIIKKIRTRKSFEIKNSTLAINTQDGNKTALDNFERFGRETYNTDDLASELKLVDEDSLFDTLNEWINWNDSLQPGTMILYFSKIKDYLHYRGIKLHPQDIKHEINFPHRIEEELYGLSREDLQKLFTVLNYKYRTIFTCQTSALMRIGEMMQLRKKHVELEGKNMIVRIPATIAKFKKGRTTFFSVEATKMAISLYNKKEMEDLLFTDQDNYRFAEMSAEQALRRALKEVHLDQRYESSGRFKINTHSMRAFGITKISRHDPNLAKKIAGQKGYMLQYDRLNETEKLEIYKKFEIDLMINDKDLQKAIILKLEMENKKNGEFYAKKFDEMYELLKDKITDHTDP